MQQIDGALYGTATGNFGGSVFKITNNGTFTTLHSFAGADGSDPHGRLMGDGLGGPNTAISNLKLCGTTSAGGAFNAGTIFCITLGGVFTLVHSFEPSTEGSGPTAPLIDGGGSPFIGLAGITPTGGKANVGTVFR